jgi:hypothetical protein
MKWLQDAVKLIPIIVTVIEAIERLFKTKSGPEKKAEALNLVEVAMQSVEAFAGKDLMKDEEFKKLVGELIDTYVAIQNYIAEHNKDKE